MIHHKSKDLYPFILRCIPAFLLSISVLPALAGENPSNASNALSRGLSNGAALSIQGSSAIVSGSLAGVSATGEFVVTSVARVGEGLVVGLKAVGKEASNAAVATSEFSIYLVGSAVVGSAVAVGATLTVAKEAFGWAIKAADRTIGYVLNDEGVTLLRQKKIA
jgi:hypothetical protein